MRPALTPRRRAEALGTASKIIFAIAAPIVAIAIIACASLILLCVPAWLLALVSGDLTKRAHEAWDALPLKDQQQ